MMAFQGDVGPLTIPTLMQEAAGSRTTGTLSLTDGPISKLLYLQDGNVIFAASTDPDDRLGGLFLRQGKISLAALDEAAAISLGNGERLGAALVRQKAIRPQDLIWGVTEQVRTTVIGLFGWTRGEYLLARGAIPSREVITLRMSTPDLIMAGIKSIESWPRVEAAIGGASSYYVATARLNELAGTMDLSLEEWILLAQCEAGATVGQLCASATLPDFITCRLLWAFSVVGLVARGEAVSGIAS